MLMAKGIANGFPVGAPITRDEIAQASTAKTISTFGGNAIGMAALIATNDGMVREGVPARVAERGRQLRAGLERPQREHKWIGDVRGMGLMQALDGEGWAGTVPQEPLPPGGVGAKDADGASTLKPPLACQVSRSSTVCSSRSPRRWKRRSTRRCSVRSKALHVVGREVRRLVEGDAAIVALG